MLCVMRFMPKTLTYENQTRIFSFIFFTFGVLLFFGLEYAFGLYFTPQYFVVHFLFGLFFPYILCAIGGNKVSYWLGFIIILIWHLGHELWEDQKTRISYVVDWDHVASGLIGLVASYFVYKYWESKVKPSSE